MKSTPSQIIALAALSAGCTQQATKTPPPARGDAQTDEPLRGPETLSEDVRKRLTALSPAELPPAPADPTNRFADDPQAAQLGKKLFFETRFSGPLLDASNDGAEGTLGLVGDTGKVGCRSCHVPDEGAFADTRSPRAQISLGAGWTRRRAPSLLDVAQMPFLMWDGRHDTAFSQPFTPLLDPLEINSSRLYVVQQVSRLYREEYQALFGPLPSLSDYATLSPEDAGCTELPTDTAHGMCAKPGHDDPEVIQVMVNVGKAIQAFTRQLTCGRSRFDQWMDGDDTALTEQEQAGAVLFVTKGECDTCHSGPYLTDRWFHNVGLAPSASFFTLALDDPGASEGLRLARDSEFSSTGDHSDGSDDRLARIPEDLSQYVGAFKTPGLRCVSRRPSFFHTGQMRSLEDVVLFFSRGGHSNGYPGQSENFPREFTDEEREQMVAFLRALDGDGPDSRWTTPPELPAD